MSSLKIFYHTGLVEESWGLILAGLDLGPLSICIAPSTRQFESWARSYKTFTQLMGKAEAIEVLAYPSPPLGDWHSQLTEEESERIRVLKGIKDKNTKKLIFTSPGALFAPCPSPNAFYKNSLELIQGESYPFALLAKRLAEELHYDAEALCEQPGQFALRGGIIDIYPLGAIEPCRLDFFGDKLESIRIFDPTTQRSLSKSPGSRLQLVSNAPSDTSTSSLLAYLETSVDWIIAEPDDCESQEGLTHSQKITTLLKARPSSDRWTSLSEFTPQLFPSQEEDRLHWQTESLHLYRSQVNEGLVGLERLATEEKERSLFFESLQHFQAKNESLLCLSSTKGDLSRLQAEAHNYPKLNFQHALAELPKGFRIHWPNKAPKVLEPLSFIQGKKGLVLITEHELFNRQRPHKRAFREHKLAQRSAIQADLDFETLVEGDLLVHRLHGICRFKGISKLNTHKDCVLSLEFQDSAILQLPIHETHLLSRYIGLSSATVKLNKLSSKAWVKAKALAQHSARDFAASLLHLHALRDLEAGFPFPEDHPWQKDMEAAFPFEPTKDQLTAIEAIKLDMQRPRPMDRLLCGDVGFGKTEVAMRAAFKAATAGKQVAVLVPTTLLCEQHFHSFCDRMAEYPISIEMLSRFRSSKEKEKIYEALAKGKIDILIGTHALLSKQIKYKDLGLLIIDEEHRFGVAHKEILKEIRASVDVLAMSATPIPRTLYMALVGARDLSVLESPPHNRLPIETLVKPYHKESIRKAILEELQRGGQVFYLHNRVKSIQKVAQTLQSLVPQAKIAVCHGKMPADELESTMEGFIAKDYDLLVATTIIESGIDIPNANTLIVESAEHFGLAQLYQLRGRVGRFDRQAYAYLFLSPNPVAKEAKERLSALSKHNQLGAGFRIAMRDLELRGAGNLLGAEQSGHIAAVGFDLYCQLLKTSVAQLKKENVTPLERAQVRIDFICLGNQAHTQDCLAAYIPENYMPELRQRMDAYRRFSNIDKLPELDALLEEFIDRFGPLPSPIKYLSSITQIRLLAETLGFVDIETKAERLICKSASGYWKIGPHFPRLTKKKPSLRLKEVLSLLKQKLSLT